MSSENGETRISKARAVAEREWRILTGKRDFYSSEMTSFSSAEEFKSFLASPSSPRRPTSKRGSP